jgi:hypothetical protein
MTDQTPICQHCRNGFFEDRRFGPDIECVNGILIDIDTYRDGYQRDVEYPVAPCHPNWDDQCQERDFPNDCQARLATSITLPDELEG